MQAAYERLVDLGRQGTLDLEDPLFYDVGGYAIYAWLDERPVFTLERCYELMMANNKLSENIRMHGYLLLSLNQIASLEDEHVWTISVFKQLMYCPLSHIMDIVKKVKWSEDLSRQVVILCLEHNRMDFLPSIPMIDPLIISMCSLNDGHYAAWEQRYDPESDVDQLLYPTMTGSGYYLATRELIINYNKGFPASILSMNDWLYELFKQGWWDLIELLIPIPTNSDGFIFNYPMFNLFILTPIMFDDVDFQIQIEERYGHFLGTRSPYIVMKTIMAAGACHMAAHMLKNYQLDLKQLETIMELCPHHSIKMLLVVQPYVERRAIELALEYPSGDVMAVWHKEQTYDVSSLVDLLWREHFVVKWRHQQGYKTLFTDEERIPTHLLMVDTSCEVSLNMSVYRRLDLWLPLLRSLELRLCFELSALLMVSDGYYEARGRLGRWFALMARLPFDLQLVVFRRRFGFSGVTYKSSAMKDVLRRFVAFMADDFWL